jgi:hypothetical protein
MVKIIQISEHNVLVFYLYSAEVDPSILPYWPRTIPSIGVLELTVRVL